MERVSAHALRQSQLDALRKVQARWMGAVMFVFYAGATVAVAYYWQLSVQATSIALAVPTVFGLLGWSSAYITRNNNERKRLEDEALEEERLGNNAELAAATALQRSAIKVHVRDLRSDVEGLNNRSGVAFAIGLLLCAASVAGPYVAWRLANEHPNNWEYMLGGSALALILLGAGSALLRHDTKLQEHMAAARTELYYFRRVQTGLDCAQPLGETRVQAGLETVIGHLLAPPPSLEVARSESHKQRRTMAADEDSNAKTYAEEPTELAEVDPEFRTRG